MKSAGKTLATGQGAAGSSALRRPSQGTAGAGASSALKAHSSASASSAAPAASVSAGGSGSGSTPGRQAAGHAAANAQNPDGTHVATHAPSPIPRSGSARKGAVAGSADPNAGNGATARALPNGRDDDVVAQRLRRAALEEKDPAVRRKLLQDYIDYRDNVLHAH